MKHVDLVIIATDLLPFDWYVEVLAPVYSSQKLQVVANTTCSFNASFQGIKIFRTLWEYTRSPGVMYLDDAKSV
jgi:hypothetical protein